MPYRCPLCDYIANSITRVKMHFHRHLERGPWICPICGAEFKDSRCLRLHVLRFNEPNHVKLRYLYASSRSKYHRKKGKKEKMRKMAEKYLRVDRV